MASYFNRLHCPMTEEAKLKIIIKNLHSFYLDRLQDPPPSAIADLRNECRKMENRRDLINNYVEPSNKRAGILEKDLAYIETESQSSSSTRDLNTIDVVNASKHIICYRCNQPGHRAIGCALPRPLKYSNVRKKVSLLKIALTVKTGTWETPAVVLKRSREIGGTERLD